MASRTTITIDGRTFSGSNVSIVGGKVVVDGVVQDGTLSGVVEIRITEGVLGSLHTDAAVTCGDIAGNVDAGMNVTCGNVEGNVDAGMNVTCGQVGGSVDAGMGVTMRR